MDCQEGENNNNNRGPERAAGDAGEVRALLSRHKPSLLHELGSTELLAVLVRRGVLGEADLCALQAESPTGEPGGAHFDIDLFVELIQAKGFEAFREFCFALEAECPHVLTDLLVDQHALAEEQENQHKLQQHRINNDASCVQSQQTDENSSGNDFSRQGGLTNECNDDNHANSDTNRQSPPPPPPPPPPPQPPPQTPTKESFLDHASNLLSNIHPMLEVLDEPVTEESEGDFEVYQVTITRVPGYGFGVAVSGGRDNPHFVDGDPSIAISDVLKAGPAEGKLQVNDRILSANGVSLEGADYAEAVRLLRDSGPMVELVLKRRIGGEPPENLFQPQQGSGQPPSGNRLSPAGSPAKPPAPTTHRLNLVRPSKKDDFGIVLGCRLFVREVTRENTGAQPGDLVTRIAGVPAENMSLKEARKLMDQSKERLALVVARDPAGGVLGPSSPDRRTEDAAAKPERSPTSGAPVSSAAAASAYSSQNLYVPPPTRLADQEKSNLAPRGRARAPIVVAEREPASGAAAEPISVAGQQQPPRPPPPRPEDYYGKQTGPLPDPRYITFQKEGSVGVRLTGGNETGVFVAAVQPNSPAALQGLQPADKILKVNDMDMKGVTREEAVLFLLSLQEQIDLIVQYRRHEYEQVVSSGKGDSFHIKTHFHYEQPDKGEMSFRSGDVFHVTDTLYNGVVGAWQVYRIGRNNQEVQKGIIPNKARAEELATAQFNATKKEMNANENRGSFFRRRKGSHRRSKSLGRDHWDDVVFSDSVSKFPAYERVVLRHPGFIRPVVLFGPVADLAREKLLKDFPDKFTCPQSESQVDEGSKSTKTSGIIRLSAIREVMDRGKHALLDITPSAVDRLNYAQFYPIVIFFKAESKQIIKEMRSGIPKSAHRSSKKLLEQCQKLDKIWGHVFSAVITLASPESWYRKLRELIEWQQQGPLWMSQTKPEEALSDDFLFPMTSRLSYASSPESDLELSTSAPMPGPLGVPSRLKSSSDPSIATQDDAVAPPPYTGYHNQMLQSLGNESHYQVDSAATLQQQVFEQHQRRRSHHQQQQQQQQSQQQHYQQQQKQSLYVQQPQPPVPAQGPPDLPPRLDRTTKPPTSPSTRTLPRVSAQERLVTKTDSVLDVGNYINASPHRVTNASATLDRSHSTKVQGSYDNVSSSYETYNTNGTLGYPGSNLNTSTGRLGPNVPDDLKSSTLGISSRPHDPYRFTRSTAIPVQDSQTARTDYAKYSRSGDYKSLPSNHPKPVGTYKPVPPPKPKNYRPPQQALIQDENNGGNLYQHAKSYSMGASHMHNGTENGLNAQRNNNQYYYNITPQNRSVQNDSYLTNTNHNTSYSHTSPGSHSHSMSHSHMLSSPSMLSHSHSNGSSQIGLSTHNRNNMTMNGHSHSSSHSGITLQTSPSIGNSHNRESSSLDLAGSREQRGSAFELYRKPLHHHNMRTMGMARGVFGNKGGILEGPGGVTLIIPPDALPANSQQEIYFSVTDANDITYHKDTRGHRSSISPPLNNGESVLSPLVECGPKGLEFKNPVELRIPHKATPAHRVALKATDTEDNSKADWLNVKLPDPTSDHVIVRLDHF